MVFLSSHLLLQRLRWSRLRRFWSLEQTRVEGDRGKQRDEVVVANLRCQFLRFSRCSQQQVFEAGKRFPGASREFNHLAVEP